MHQLIASTSTSLSRRTLLKGTALGVGAAGIGVAVGAARQIDLPTPEPATPEAVFPVEPLDIGLNVASKAAELDFDVERMFRFVADEIQYEPYAGALRGANGTLWSLAGNSVDKSLLFAALLDEALIEYRFAFGALDEAGINALTAAIQTDSETLTNQFAEAQLQGLLPPLRGAFDDSVATPGADEPLTAEEEQALDDALVTTTAIFDRASELSEQHMSIIQESLTAAGIEVPVAEYSLPAEETSRHTWIQIADGPAWVDYATALRDSQSGVAPSSTTPETTAMIPADLIHMVTIRVVAEEYLGGTAVRRDALNVPFTSAELVNEPVALQVLPPESLSNIGFTLNALLTGQVAFVPSILANDVGSFADSPLFFGGGDGTGDVLSAEPAEGVTLSEGETLALWLALDIASPGQAPLTVERPLFDRIGFEARQAEAIDFTAIGPVEMVEGPTGQSFVAGLTPAHQISVDSAYIPYTYAARDRERQEMFGDLAMANSGLLSLRDNLRMKLEIPQGIRPVISSPQVTLVSASKIDPLDLTSGVLLEFDLLHRASTSFTIGDANPELNPAILTGITNQIAEQLAIEIAAEGAPDPSAIALGATVGAIFSAAIDQDIAIASISDVAEIADLDLIPEVAARLTSAIESGLIVVIPESPVDLGGSQRSGWWLIDPTTGVTRDELDNGKGSASFSLMPDRNAMFATSTEHTFVIRLGSTSAQYYRMLGFRTACILSGIAFGMFVAVGAMGAAGGRGRKAAGGAAGAGGSAGAGALVC